MPMTKLLIYIILFSSFFGRAQCDSNLMNIYEVRGNDTDNNIAWKLKRNIVMFNPACTPLNKLVLFLPGTDTPLLPVSPSNYSYFLSTAANNGFHTIGLEYENNNGTTQDICSNSTDVNCFSNFRKETIEGIDVSPDISVDYAHSIINRTYRLLEYLDINHPSEGWWQYYANDTVAWSKVIVAGHSQGGGHAAYMAITKKLDRVLMFASPNDYSDNFSSAPSWISEPHLTNSNAYFSFNNSNDITYINQNSNSITLGVNTPNEDVISSYCPFSQSRLLYESTDVGLISNHISMIVDNFTPLDGNGNRKFDPVWQYMLGINCSESNKTELNADKIEIYPTIVESTLFVQSNNPVHGISIIDPLGFTHISKLNFNQVDVTNLSAGYYFVLIESGSKQYLKKFVKM